LEKEKCDLPRVNIVDYDPQWPLLFQEEKRRVLEVMGHKVLAFEHVGSTAVPGLGAKPSEGLLMQISVFHFYGRLATRVSRRIPRIRIIIIVAEKDHIALDITCTLLGSRAMSGRSICFSVTISGLIRK